jgi:hypothetical protein
MTDRYGSHDLMSGSNNGEFEGTHGLMTDNSEGNSRRATSVRYSRQLARSTSAANGVLVVTTFMASGPTLPSRVKISVSCVALCMTKVSTCNIQTAQPTFTTPAAALAQATSPQQPVGRNVDQLVMCSACMTSVHSQSDCSTSSPSRFQAGLNPSQVKSMREFMVILNA